MKPKPKVKAAGIGGIVATLVLLVFGVDIGPEVAAAITTLVTFVAGYLKSE